LKDLALGVQGGLVDELPLSLSNWSITSRTARTTALHSAPGHGLGRATGRRSGYVEFIGHSNNIAKLLANAMFLAHSSDVEGCPNAMMEAMACGRAVAARRLPPKVANKPKWGFSIPLEVWLGADLKANLKEALLDPSMRAIRIFSTRGI